MLVYSYKPRSNIPYFKAHCILARYEDYSLRLTRGYWYREFTVPMFKVTARISSGRETTLADYNDGEKVMLMLSLCCVAMMENIVINFDDLMRIGPSPKLDDEYWNEFTGNGPMLDVSNIPRVRISNVACLWKHLGKFGIYPKGELQPPWVVNDLSNFNRLTIMRRARHLITSCWSLIQVIYHNATLVSYYDSRISRTLEQVMGLDEVD